MCPDVECKINRYYNSPHRTQSKHAYGKHVSCCDLGEAAANAVLDVSDSIESDREGLQA